MDRLSITRCRVEVDYTSGELPTRTKSVPNDGRTLSGVTRRADAGSGPDEDRRVTFDRAVWTKPLAFAADAGDAYGR
jgi:hypothetical protein